MRLIARVAAVLATLPMLSDAFAQSCGSCPTNGACLPIDPLVAFGDHGCEDHQAHDHSGAVAPGVDLSRSVLFFASFAGAQLQGADLSDAFTSGALFTGAQMQGADISRTGNLLVGLDGADLTGARCHDLFLWLSSTGKNSVFADAELNGAWLLSVDFTGANLDGADLTGAWLLASTFAGASFRGATFTGTDLGLVDLTGADLSNATGLASTLGSAIYDSATAFTGTGFDPVVSGWHLVTSAPLTGQPSTMSVSTGGEYRLGLNAGASLSSFAYLVLGSASGTSPGTPLSSTWTLPLNATIGGTGPAFDPYFVATATQPNSPPFDTTWGAIRPSGHAAATVNVPPLGPNAAGLTLDHAYVVFWNPPFSSPLIEVLFVSNPVSLSLVP